MVASIANKVLTLIGAAVGEIPTSYKEESDWLATLGGFSLLVEEKTKLENPELAAARANSIASGQVHGTTTSLRPNKGISRIIHKAAKQLSSTAADRTHDARILWFTSTGFDREAKDFQAFNTLYGATKVFDLDVSASLRDCFFFHFSEFYKHPGIDGAVLAIFDGQNVTLRLCLNPYSDNWQTLRESPFAAKFGAPVDPLAQEAEGLAMIADTDLDRRNSEAILDFLRAKYRIPKLLSMDMNMASAVVGVPRDGA
jgi:hypothetical protein